MQEPILTPSVLRQMVLERVEAAHRGEVSKEYLHGYLTAMFHAGAISIEELKQLLTSGEEPFILTP